MYEKELLPEVIAIGIRYDEFWQLNPRKLNVIMEGYKLKRKVEDESQWLFGGYVFHAVSVAMGNAFRKKGVKAQSYFEILEKPFLDSVQKEELSETEKQRYINSFMANLQVMQSNFESNHRK